MTHLNIQQDNTATEEVTSKIIERLYNAVYNGTLDNTSQLVGKIHATVGYQEQVQYLNTRYSGLLYVQVDDFAIKFEDPKVLYYLNSIDIGGNGYVTLAQAAAATKVSQHAISSITKFNELRYFTNIVQSGNGYTSASSGKARFMDWTSLQEIDISNFISLGHNNNSAYEDTFRNCSSLTTVTASNNLKQLGNAAFAGCSNLSSLTGLEGNIDLYGSVFSGCSSLPDSTFSNVTAFHLLGGSGTFYKCVNLTTIPFSGQETQFGAQTFDSCTNLEHLTGLSGTITLAGDYIFRSCSKLQSDSFDNVQFIYSSGSDMFKGCSSLTSITLSPQCVVLGYYMFLDCSNLTTINNTSNVQRVGRGCFGGCSKLTSLDLSGLDFSNDTVKDAFAAHYSSAKSLFQNTSALTTIGVNTIPYITKLDVNLFRNSAISGSLSFPDLTEIDTNGYGCQFLNCTNLTKLSFGHFVTVGVSTGANISRGMFTGCTNLKILDLGDSVQDIKKYNCYNCSNLKAVVLNVSTPPIFSGNNNTTTLTVAFGNADVDIYVPDAAVSAYQAADGWNHSSFAGHIKPMSQYNESAILAS